MNQQADGYFLNPQPAYDSPDAASHLDTHESYVDAGVDTFSFTVRGGTHLEWSYIPLILPATSYGIVQAGYYTLAWFDRYVHPSAARQAAGSTALVAGPVTGRRDRREERVPVEGGLLLGPPWVSAARFHTVDLGASSSPATSVPMPGSRPSAIGRAPMPTTLHPAPKLKPVPSGRRPSEADDDCPRPARRHTHDRQGASRPGEGAASLRRRASPGCRRRRADRPLQEGRQPSTRRRWNGPGETAAPIAKAVGTKVVVDRGLIECDFGEWTGAELAKLAKLPEWQIVQRAPSTFRFPGGESFQEC